MFTFTEPGVCVDCEGDGAERLYVFAQGLIVTNKPCPSCLGTGAKLTDAGRELVTFLTKHFDLKVRTR